MADPRGFDTCPEAELEKELGTVIASGLTSSVVAEKQARDGPNELEKQKAPGLLMLFVTQLVQLLVLRLWK